MTAWHGRHCGDSEEGDDVFAITPWQLLIKLQNGPAVGFSDLIEAPGQFYKKCKNSYRLHLTFRISTKFGGPKIKCFGHHLFTELNMAIFD